MRGVGSIDCERCTELLDEYFGGKLDEASCAALEAHALNCGTCASKMAEHRLYLERMAPFRVLEEPPAGFRDGWLRAVREERQRRRRARFRIQVASAAAALMLLVGAGFFLSLANGARGNDVAATVPEAVGAQPDAITHLTTVQPDKGMDGLALQATAAAKGADDAADYGTAAGPQNVVLHVDDVHKTMEELLSLADRNGIDARPVAADACVVALDPAARPVIEPFIARYSDKKLSDAGSLVLTITVRSKSHPSLTPGF
ncbi:MAG: zf-HC2 domain-containing protein [Clostridiales bacterium]|nr:zf-HC2 domain-containing protein [Clostridiales bacterium]